MNELKKNCDWDLIDWEFEEEPGSITIKETPEICAECEFFQACFMIRSSEVLGVPPNP